MAMFEDIASAAADETSLRLLRRATLIGIAKKPSGVRPIAMGEAFVKVSARLLLLSDRGLTSSQAVGDSQFAFEKCGRNAMASKGCRTIN